MSTQAGRIELIARQIKSLVRQRNDIEAQLEKLKRDLRGLNLKTYKEWVLEEGSRVNLGYNGVHTRILDGKYPHLRKIHINARVVFVYEEGKQ